MKQEHTFTFEKITLIRETCDNLLLHCSNAESPFPELNKLFPDEYHLTIKIEIRKGYAEEWCRRMGITIDQTIIV
jgi:hypothetical protein